VPGEQSVDMYDVAAEAARSRPPTRVEADGRAGLG
jgi:hypothetical protein